MTNLDLMHRVDEAWNGRDWDSYAQYFHADLKAFANDSPQPHGRQRHLERAGEFCAAYPDAKVHEPYLAAFNSIDGSMTCTVSRLTGGAAGGGSGFDITMAVITCWENGQMIEQRQFIDERRMLDQLASGGSR